MSDSSLIQPSAPSSLKEAQPAAPRARVLAVMVCYNTGRRTREVLERFPRDSTCDFVVVNDGSTDETTQHLAHAPCPILHHDANCGVGRAIKTGIAHALQHGYEIIVIMAGNGKDDPQQIPRLLKPIFEDGYDYVQGSRFAAGGQYDNLPLFRYVMVKVHAVMFWLLTGFHGTDALNGFRAYRARLFEDPRINAWQEWLDGYEFETYFHYKVLKLGYRVCEVPVSKTYPPKQLKEKYSHIRPIIDWWHILSPLLYLMLRLRR